MSGTVTRGMRVLYITEILRTSFKDPRNENEVRRRRKERGERGYKNGHTNRVAQSKSNPRIIQLSESVSTLQNYPEEEKEKNLFEAAKLR